MYARMCVGHAHGNTHTCKGLGDMPKERIVTVTDMLSLGAYDVTIPANAETGTAETTETRDLFSIPVEVLRALPESDIAKTGVVLCSERRKVNVIMPDGKPAQFTASIYISRDPVTEDEYTRMTQTAEERDAARAEKERKELEQQQRDKQAAFEMGLTAAKLAARDSIVAARADAAREATERANAALAETARTVNAPARRPFVR